jgi:ribokinase
VRWVRRDRRAPTGASVLISSHDRNAAIFTFRGANTLLEPVDLIDEAFAVDAVYVSNLSNKSAECLSSIVRQAKTQGAVVAVNPGLRQLSAYSREFQDDLGKIDILSLNRTEACALVPYLVAKSGEGGPMLPLAPNEEPPSLAARGLSGGGFEMSLVAFFRALAAAGLRYVVLTDGSRGAFVATKDKILYCPAAQCSVVGTAGAGDAFASTFTAFIILGRSASDALRAATVNAASVVGYVDTQTGLMKGEALDAALAGTAATLAVRSWPLFGKIDRTEESRPF